MKLFKTMYLALNLALISSCTQDKEIKHKDYETMPGSIFQIYAIGETAFMYDYSKDGNIDLIRYGHETHPSNRIIAIDSTLAKNELFRRAINHTIPLTEEMRDLATKITELQRELNFKIDSTYNARSFLPSTQHK